MKRLYRILLVPVVGFASLLSSCSDEQVDDFFRKYVQAPEASIERDVKGHDQIYAIHAILRMGHKGGRIGVGPNGDDEIDSYVTYQTVGDINSIPIMQEIDISKDDEGQMVVTTERDHFDVVVADDIYYGLELRYYDQNGMLINHQFSAYPFKKDEYGSPVPDEDNSTLLVHQHFFSIGNSSLDQDYRSSGKELKLDGMQLAYPRTLDQQPRYYDKYAFRLSGDNAERATKFSSNNMFAPENYIFGSNSIAYDKDLAWRTIELANKPEATQPYLKDGKTYLFYKAIDMQRINELAPEIFTYEYRDTDPVEEELGKMFVDSYVDDFVDPDEDAPRQRYGHTVGLLRQQRSLDVGAAPDRLGFKGILQFKQANMAFQMQVRICHIQNKGQQRTGEAEKPAKYINIANESNGFLWNFNQIQPGWDSFDIDYPLPIRVIADKKNGEDKCYEDVKRFYPNVDKAQLWQMLSNPSAYLSSYRRAAVVM